MNKDGLKKYAKYAVGEIFLVVVGILLALEVNTLNQNWQASKEEQKTLKNLRTDYAYNMETIQTLMDQTEIRLSSNNQLLGLTGPNPSASLHINIDSLIGKAAGVPIYLPREGFLNELIHTGNLQIIKNDQLRNKLSLWKPYITYLKNREESALIAMRRTASFLGKNGSWLNVDQYHPLMKSDMPPPTFDTDNRDMLGHQEFQNYIVSGVWALNILKSKQEDIVEINREILTLIDQEIK